MKPLLSVVALAFVYSLAGMAMSEPGNSDMPDIPNRIQPDSQTLIGGQPDRDQLRQAREAGIKTVVNLRGVEEFNEFDARKAASDLGLLYIHIPIAGTDDLNRQTLEAFDQAVAAAGDEPALYHCASGNRVGAMFALRAGILNGKSPEDAVEVGRRHGLTGLEPVVMELLESGQLPDAR